MNEKTKLDKEKIGIGVAYVCAALVALLFVLKVFKLI
jgi:hypothetical protein